MDAETSRYYDSIVSSLTASSPDYPFSVQQIEDHATCEWGCMVRDFEERKAGAIEAIQNFDVPDVDKAHQLTQATEYFDRQIGEFDKHYSTAVEEVIRVHGVDPQELEQSEPGANQHTKTVPEYVADALTHGDRNLTPAQFLSGDQQRTLRLLSQRQHDGHWQQEFFNGREHVSQDVEPDSRIVATQNEGRQALKHLVPDRTYTPPLEFRKRFNVPDHVPGNNPDALPERSVTGPKQRSLTWEEIKALKPQEREVPFSDREPESSKERHLEWDR